jgi:hypothetical protein
LLVTCALTLSKFLLDTSIFDDGPFDISELETFGSSSKYSRISQYDGGCDSNSDQEASTSSGRMLRSRANKGKVCRKKFTKFLLESYTIH